MFKTCSLSQEQSNKQKNTSTNKKQHHYPPMHRESHRIVLASSTFSQLSFNPKRAKVPDSDSGFPKKIGEDDHIHSE